MIEVIVRVMVTTKNAYFAPSKGCRIRNVKSGSAKNFKTAENRTLNIYN